MFKNRDLLHNGLHLGPSIIILFNVQLNTKYGPEIFSWFYIVETLTNILVTVQYISTTIYFHLYHLTLLS